MDKRTVAIVAVVLVVIVVAVIATIPRKRPAGGGAGMDAAGNFIPPPSGPGEPGKFDVEGAGQLEIRVYAGEDRVGDSSELYVCAPDDHEHPVAEPEDGIAETLKAGDYDVLAVYKDKFGVERKKWKTGLTVEDGKLLREEIKFDFGYIAVDLGGAGTAYTAKDVEVAVFPPGDETSVLASGKADKPVKVLEGTYDVRLVLGTGKNSEPLWRRDVKVEEGKTATLEANFSGGSLVVILQGGKALPGAKVAVHESGDTSSPIAQGEPGDEFPIDPGTYDVKVSVGEGEGEYEHWEKGVAVEAGKVNRVNISLPVGTIKVNAFTTGGGQIPGHDFYVYVYNQGESANSIVKSSGEWTIALEPANYDLRVEYTNSQDKPSVWISGVAVAEGKHQTLRADFQSTSITVIATVGGKEVPGNLIQVYYYPAADTSRYITSTIGGVPATLSEGRYKIKVEYTGKPKSFEEWAGDVSLESGKAKTVTHALEAGWAKFVTTGGELTDARNESHGTVAVGDEVLLPIGVYFLTNEEGVRLMVEVGPGAGKTEV
ncbi:MAG: hypothetical protein HRF49_10015 [bacterium]|jgi:hypothetical protein